MKRQRIRLYFAVCEFLCLLCYSALAVSVGHFYRIRNTIPVLIWGMCLYFCAVLLLVFLAVFWRWRHKQMKNFIVVLTFLLSFQISFYLLKQTIYWNDMFELGFVSDAATAVKYGLWFIICTVSLLGLQIWGVFLRRTSKSEQA